MTLEIMECLTGAPNARETIECRHQHIGNQLRQARISRVKATEQRIGKPYHLSA